ncbi:MAG TPA: DUF1385 domain-containing protein [Thermotogota bacterium]|jgi:uncharacterized protein YqhQ|nr:MAG: hypothetical protein BWX67_00362 [Thermotogota bacterium ADurb.Bin062]HNW45823.1 DUF1385 domain-containing protein [Thermotogota bacterium]HNY81422.1 DUF1385 domain-containing protein [Thermotogota bacterium]HOD90568.1 DUF1385 domain-containing protein [Thermotogota bacterium]HOF23245.1 DUF1385 domain-containing protein [Thermotogota bacterium]
MNLLQVEESMAAGGQAVIEGVLMRAKKTAIAVRQPDRKIVTREYDKPMLIKRFPVLGTPFIRGVCVLWDSMYMGIVALSWSAEVSSQDTGEELKKKDIVGAILFALALAIGLFVLAPFLVAQLIPAIKEDPVSFALFEGIIRVAILVLYIWAVSRSKDVKRVFEYHGAEHKTVHAYEAGVELTVNEVRKYSRIHPRCGTSFLFITMIAAIIVLIIANSIWQVGFWQKLLIRILFIPVIASISYEFLRFTAKHLDNPLFRALAWPGMLLQRLTTAEPDDDQLEVAIVSLKSAVGALETEV